MTYVYIVKERFKNDKDWIIGEYAFSNENKSNRFRELAKKINTVLDEPLKLKVN